MVFQKNKSGVYRNVCCTIFCETAKINTFEELKNALETKLSLAYLISQKEKCAKTGRIHFQTYFRLTKRVRFNTIKKTIPSMHFKNCKGSEEANVKYCSKEDTRIEKFIEWGERAKQGERTDLVGVCKNLVDTADNLKEAIETCTNYQQIKVVEKLYQFVYKDRSEQKVFWYHGKTRTGKTVAAWKYATDNNLSVWPSNKNLDWFNGYWGQDVVIIDDFRPSTSTFDWFLRVTDNKPIQVPTKGGFVPFYPKVIIITCPYTPEECYKNRSDEDIQQLIERCEEIKLFGQEHVFRKQYNNNQNNNSFGYSNWKNHEN